MAAEVLVAPGRAPADSNLSASAMAPGQPVNIISRAGWGADESIRRGIPRFGIGIRAGVVHHSATGNGYAPTDSAAIVRSIYECHTLTQGWGDIGYNALVDKYGQMFEGRFGGITKSVEGVHTGGFNTDTWAVCMIGDLSQAPPTPEQLRAVGQLLGWRLAMDAVNPNGTVMLTSAGGPDTRFPRGATPTLPSIFAHRDVGDTACPGNAGYAFMERIRDIAARFTQPPSPQDLAESLRGGAIYDRWQATGGMTGGLGAPTSPEAACGDSIRYVVFANGAIYWSSGHRRSAAQRQDLRGMGHAGLRARPAGPADQRRDSGAGVDRAELPARHAELRTANLNRHDCDGRDSQCGTTAARGRTACPA